MKTKTIRKVLRAKLQKWIDSIEAPEKITYDYIAEIIDRIFE